MSLNHLLIVTPGFPEDEQDTTCLPYLQQFVLSYQLQYPNTEITILSLHHPFQKSNYNWHGMDVHCCMGRNKAGISRVKTIYKAYKKGLSINRHKKIDAVLSIWVTDGALAAKYIARKTRVPHFTWAWGQEVKPGNKYMKLVNPKAAHMAVMSDFQNEILFQSYGIKAKHIIPNGIVENVFPILNTGKRDIHLLAVGSLIPLKQYHLFIEIVKWLTENGRPDIKAVLAGDGVLMKDLKALVANYKLENNIEILGAVPHKDVFDLMNNAKLFVHPSNYEGHSTVMLEALYSGCKVVSFMPVATSEVLNFALCNTIDEMKEKVFDGLNNDIIPCRVVYSTWQQNVERIYSILIAMINS